VQPSIFAVIAGRGRWVRNERSFAHPSARRRAHHALALLV